MFLLANLRIQCSVGDGSRRLGIEAGGPDGLDGTGTPCLAGFGQPAGFFDGLPVGLAE